MPPVTSDSATISTSHSVSSIHLLHTTHAAYTRNQLPISHKKYMTPSLLRNDNIFITEFYVFFFHILTFWYGHTPCEVLFDNVLQQHPHSLRNVQQ